MQIKVIMKSITLHKIDDRTVDLIEQRSKEWGLSLNRTIQKLLHESLGIKPTEQPKQDEFGEFFGIWSEEDFQEFEKNTLDSRQIDSSDWK